MNHLKTIQISSSDLFEGLDSIVWEALNCSSYILVVFN